MNTFQNTTRALLLTAALPILASCGSGGGASPTAPQGPSVAEVLTGVWAIQIEAVAVECDDPDEEMEARNEALGEIEEMEIAIEIGENGVDARLAADGEIQEGVFDGAELEIDGPGDRPIALGLRADGMLFGQFEQVMATCTFTFEIEGTRLADLTESLFEGDPVGDPTNPIVVNVQEGPWTFQLIDENGVPLFLQGTIATAGAEVTFFSDSGASTVTMQGMLTDVDNWTPGVEVTAFPPFSLSGNFSSDGLLFDGTYTSALLGDGTVLASFQF